MVRVELTARPPRPLLEGTEDNHDGTWTRWRGMLVDETGAPIREDVLYEAVIQLTQVKTEWVEAVVRSGVRRANIVLEHEQQWHRYFGEE